MPKIGEIKNGAAIGRKDTGAYTWHACEVCGKERWVQIRVRKNNLIKVKVCFSCRGANISGQNSPNWKGGVRKESSGYILVYVTSDDFYFPMANRTRAKSSHKYGGYVGEHRLVMAKSLGRCLQSWEIVHHKNGIKDDNRTKNLELQATIGEHLRGHGGGYKEGYRKGFTDGRSAKIKQLTERIKELEKTST